MTPKRLNKLMASIKDIGLELPCSIYDAQRIRGCGNKSIIWLIEHGAIIPQIGPYDGTMLSMRARNCLERAGLMTKEDVIDKLLDGSLSPHGKDRIHYGKSTHKEVFEWAFCIDPDQFSEQDVIRNET